LLFSLLFFSSGSVAYGKQRGRDVTSSGVLLLHYV
jgi:hypothetical protein